MRKTRDPLLDFFEVPAQYELRVARGWEGLGLPGDAVDVQIRDSTLPQHFACYVWCSDPEDEWVAMLLFLADPADDEVRLLSVIAPKFEADIAVKKIQEVKPLEWWHNYAIVALSRSKARLDDADMADFYAIGYGSRLKAFARHPANQVRDASSSPNRKREQMTDELFQKVSAVYLDAQEAGDRPISVVARHFEKTYPTASRWVAEARKRGFLPPADKASASAEK